MVAHRLRGNSIRVETDRERRVGMETWSLPRRWRLLVPLALVGVFQAALLHTAVVSAQADDASAARASAAGRVVFRRTRVETPSVDAQPPTGPDISVARGDGGSDQGLEQRSGDTPAGGIIVDVHGRFGSMLVVAAAPNGRLEATCIEPSPLDVGQRGRQ